MKVAEAETLQPVMQFSGANACDIAMTVSAMDLLQSGKLEGFCIASSDGDFTPLVHRLRSAGLKVFGFGGAKAAPSLRKACTGYTTIPEILKPVAVTRAAA